MINDLRYAVTFPSNGISLTGHHCFQPGATAISGRNGKGKSFIAEMVRYGIFGKKALRGPASDYKSLDMELSFLGHTVKRGKKEVLTNPEGEQIAVGADAVNKKIIELLGFGLEVFDVVCAANQKESERLTRLTPAKRKELIDDIVGLTAQEAIEKACREEAKGLAREAEALMRMLSAPVEPTKPEGYRPAVEIKAEYDETVALAAKRAKLQRIIDNVGQAPEAPAEPVGDITALEAHEQKRVEAEARFVAIEEAIARIPDAKYTRKELEVAAELLEYDAEVARRGPEPLYRADELDHFEAILDAHDLETEEVTCPKCSHEFHPGLNPAQEELRLHISPISRATLREQRRAIDNWAEPLVEPKGEHLSRQEIIEGMKAIDRADEKTLLKEELARLPSLEPRPFELEAARTRQQLWAVYNSRKADYDARFEDSVNAVIALEDLPELKAKPEDLHAELTAATVYEQQLERYEADKAKFDKLSAEIGVLQTRADGFTAGAKGLVEARRTLKAFLAPSLSRVASAMVNQMTVADERPLYEVLVDEDMNITVDGQDVATFNGARATMINLALRLALGQVLVSRVMPLFIGDEIDSDLDEANAQALADAILALKDQLKQVVIISHKRLENFDHEITLS